MYSSYRQTTPPGGHSMPELDEAQALGILGHLDHSELKRLLEGEGKLDDLINDLQQVKSLKIDREMLVTSNKSLAEFNLSREPRLEQGKQQLVAMFDEARDLRKDYEKNKEKLDLQASQQSLDTTLALLQTAAAEADEKSEELADDLLDGKIDAEAFIENYIPKRKSAHLLKVKAEKMPGLIQQQQQQQQQQVLMSSSSSSLSSASGHGLYNSHSSGSLGGAPYPTSGHNPYVQQMPTLPYRR